MSFRDFISNFRYRRKAEAEFARYQAIQPPAKPTRQYVDRLVEQLLRESSAHSARRELSLMGLAAAPSLIAALKDARFHRAEEDEYSIASSPLHAVLELLVGHADEEVIQAATPLAMSPSTEVRKSVALQLASVGRSSTIPVLRRLMDDSDGYVRAYVAMGMRRAVQNGRADPAFCRLAYDLLISQVDHEWGSAMNDSAGTIIALDPARAAGDFSDDRLLNLANPNLSGIIEACNRARILLPESTVRRLLDKALSMAVGERCYPNNYVVAAALNALAMRNADDLEPLLITLLEHDQKKIQEAAAEALAQLSGVNDPTGLVIEKVHREGYESLTHQQQVVYCACIFDFEVCNGGLMQFFGNSSGDHVDDTLAALAELDHQAAYAALESAVRLVGPLAREPDRELRLTGFEGRWDELRPAFEPLDSAYYASDVKLRQAVLLYAVRHRSHFEV